MKALRKQRLCSFLWGWGKWENRPCSIQKRPGISLPDRFSLFQGGTYGAPLQIPGRFILARAVQHIPVTRRNSLRRPSRQSMAFIGPRQRSGEKDKRESLRRPPVNPWLSSDRASGLRKRQKGQLTLSLLSIYSFHRTAPAVWEKDKRDNLRRPSCQFMAFIGPRQRSEKKDKRDSLRRPSCQSMAFTRPRQRSGKKTKGTACAVPPVYGVIIKFR